MLQWHFCPCHWSFWQGNHLSYNWWNWRADRDESLPYAAMLAAQDVAQRYKELGITALHIKLRASGGNRTKTPGPGAQSPLRALAHSRTEIGRIGDVTPNPSDSTCGKGGHYGCYLWTGLLKLLFSVNKLPWCKKTKKKEKNSGKVLLGLLRWLQEGAKTSNTFTCSLPWGGHGEGMGRANLFLYIVPYIGWG